MQFEVTRELVGNQAWVLRVEGEVDIDTAESLRTHLQEALGAEPSMPVVCDLQGVDYLDSVGISVLIAASAQAAAAGRAFCVAGPRGQVRRTLELVRLMDMVSCFPTDAAALEAGAEAWMSTARTI